MGTISLFPAAADAAGRSLAVLRVAGMQVVDALGACVVVMLNWQRRAGERHALEMLDERALRDIGIMRSDAEREARKPFWLA